MKDHDENNNKADDLLDENADDDIIELTELVEKEPDSEKDGALDPDAETIIEQPSYYDETVGVSKLLDEDDGSPFPGADESNGYEETIGFGQLLEEDDDEEVLELDEETIVAPPDLYEQTIGVGKLLDDDSVSPPEADQEEDMITLDEETIMEQPDLYEQTIGIGKLFENEEDREDFVDLDEETMIAPPDAFDETMGPGVLSEEDEDFDAVVDLDAETIISFTETDGEDIEAQGQPETDEAEDSEDEVIDLEDEGMISDADEGEEEEPEDGEDIEAQGQPETEEAEDSEDEVIDLEDEGMISNADEGEAEEIAEDDEAEDIDALSGEEISDEGPFDEVDNGEDIDASPLEDMDLDEEHLDSDIPIESLEKIPEEDQMTDPLWFPEENEKTETNVADAASIEDDETESLDLDDIIEKTTIDKEDIFDLDEASAPIIEKEVELSEIEEDTVTGSELLSDLESESPAPVPDLPLEAPAEPTKTVEETDAHLEPPIFNPHGGDQPEMDPEKEKDLLDLLDMDLEGKADAAADVEGVDLMTDEVAMDTEIFDDLEPEPRPEAYPEAGPTGPPEIGATPAEADADLAAALEGIAPEAFEAALERVIRKVFEEKIESVLSKAVEKVVSREIQKLKDVLITDASMDD